jgi:DNA repair exonuclease SbcCD ATPase subunit
MIPQRIWLKGLLSYRDEQELRFDGGALWMLAGPNGSGKSSVFDAVTYALFGQHRGGRQNARELINKDSEGLAVEFDFLLDGTLYQARRTLRKKSKRSTRQIHCFEDGSWRPVPETGSEVGFADWVREHIGLTYETFTSSVLLLQGKADKLLAAEPAERFRVLAGIVDLGRYQELADRADLKRREFESAATALGQQLEALPPVNGDEIEAIVRSATAAESDKRAVQAKMECLQRRLVLAERSLDLEGKLAETRADWERAQGALARATATETDWQRLQELRQVLPHIGSALEARARLGDSKCKRDQLAAARDQLAAQVAALEQVLDEGRRRRDALRQAVAGDEGREEAIALRLRELSGPLEVVAYCEQQRQELARLEDDLRRMPVDLPKTREHLQSEYDRHVSLNQAMPHLRRLHAARKELALARERARSTADAERAALLQQEQLVDPLAETAMDAERAAALRQAQHDAATERRTRLHEAGEQVRLFDELAGAKVCRHCGQSLTPGHYAEERARRQKERAAAQADYENAERALEKATRAAEDSAAVKRKKEEDWQRAGQEAAQWRRAAEQAACDAERYRRDCELAYRDMEASFQGLVGWPAGGDWLATSYPSPLDLAEVVRQVERLDSTRQLLQQAQSAYESWSRLQAQVAGLSRALAEREAELPADLPALREECRRLETEASAVRARLVEVRASTRQEQDWLDQAVERRQELAQQLAEHDRRFNEERVRAQECQGRLTLARSVLPPVWQSAAETATCPELHQWQAERAGLEAVGVEAHFRELEEVRTGLEALRQRKAGLESDLEAIPPEARRAPAEVQALLATANDELLRREAALQEAMHAQGRLEHRHEQREQLQDQYRQADRRHALYRTLGEQLGRKGLQLYLMRQAEHGIIDFANGVLDRLSGGRFCLRLRNGENGEKEHALELEAYDRFRGQVFALPFLSGSQRFRVAVSLALGVGQYASRQHRPIESVIIDEGFGCLDREGRQVMIQELQNLRTQLRCILLVSHQEEFADAFADGYHFRLDDGTTRARRFSE